MVSGVNWLTLEVMACMVDWNSSDISGSTCEWKANRAVKRIFTLGMTTLIAHCRSLLAACDLAPIWMGSKSCVPLITRLR